MPTWEKIEFLQYSRPIIPPSLISVASDDECCICRSAECVFRGASMDLMSPSGSRRYLRFLPVRVTRVHVPVMTDRLRNKIDQLR